eukprot:GILJ01011487.1.p1 GENE.GILJ01011487.1~~GILJ01011487.1.p1  ORF type:complete len:894 (+),score=143.65 GILJ01011487.1:56-2737(+)
MGIDQDVPDIEAGMVHPEQTLSGDIVHTLPRTPTQTIVSAMVFSDDDDENDDEAEVESDVEIDDYFHGDQNGTSQKPSSTQEQTTQGEIVKEQVTGQQQQQHPPQPAVAAGPVVGVNRPAMYDPHYKPSVTEYNQTHLLPCASSSGVGQVKTSKPKPIARPYAALYQATGKIGKRHPFHDQLVEKRRMIGRDRWDKKKLAVVVPCYNEKNDVSFTLESTHQELACFLKGREVKHLQMYFVIDGSGVDQLLTAKIMLETMSKLFVDNKTYLCRHVAGDMQEPMKQLERLLALEKEIVSLKKKRLERGLVVLDMEELDDEIRSIQKQKRAIFVQEFSQIVADYEYYNTRLLRHDFLFECAYLKDIYLNRPEPREMKFQVTLLIKESNRQKRDSLLLCIHSCFLDQRVPWSLGFVDCDTNWQRGSLHRMRTFLGRHKETAAVSGMIVVRNEKFWNPITTLQDFNYLFSQIATKEAEHFFGMVTCCPGAFSMTKLEPATEPDVVLPEISKYAESIEEKNRIELGEDRFWTTLLLERGFDQDKSANTRVSYLTTAVAETDAPDNLVTYMLQQRRWINSTNANFAFGLIPKLNRFVFKCNRRVVGITYLWLRSFFDQISFIISPGIIGLLMVTMLLDIDFPYALALVIASAVLLTAPLIVLMFPNPRNFPRPYQLYTAVTSVGSGALMLYWFYITIPKLFAGGYEDVSNALRIALLLAFFFCVFSLTIIHGKLRGFIPPYKAFISLMFIPLQNVLLPTYCTINLADFSWGNRDTQARSTAAETAASQRTAKSFFFFFLVINTGVFALQFLDSSYTGPLFLIFEALLLFSVFGTFIFSFLAAIRSYCKAIGRGTVWICRKMCGSGTTAPPVTKRSASQSRPPVVPVAAVAALKPVESSVV